MPPRPPGTLVIKGLPVEHPHHPNMWDNGWAEFLGKSDTILQVTMLGRPGVELQAVLEEAARAADSALKSTGYEDPCDFIGSFNVRAVSGRDLWSEHAYGTAFDLDFGGHNPASPDHPLIDRNPDLGEGNGLDPGDARFGVVCQLLEHQVVAVEGIRTNNGRRVWGWLGWRKRGDTMHFRAVCSPDDLDTGIDWTTVTQGGSFMEFAIAVLRRQDDLFWTELRRKTGIPAGDPMFWAPSGTEFGAKATDQEWRDAAEIIFAAALAAGVLNP
jgi:hypothetical protein